MEEPLRERARGEAHRGFHRERHRRVERAQEREVARGMRARGIDELRERYGAERTLIVDLEEPSPPLAIPGARVERVDGPRQWLRFRGSASELTARVAAAARIVDLQVQEPDIEEIVRRIYSEPGSRA